MSEHTPGPWVVYFANGDGANDVLPAGRPGCLARDIESEADASLIAAAPEMLTALITNTQNWSLLADRIRSDDPKFAALIDWNVEVNNQVIARAEGRER